MSEQNADFGDADLDNYGLVGHLLGGYLEKRDEHGRLISAGQSVIPLYECGTCSALVAHVQSHTAWHHLGRSSEGGEA